ncbi:MAG: hypothetical protein M0Q02_10100 [Candidatus Muirbacterium halophilum]|nr:hypothetical protein [Candidatus Muirbacterium halophilum]
MGIIILRASKLAVKKYMGRIVYIARFGRLTNEPDNLNNIEEKYYGIFIPHDEYYYGLKNVEEVDISSTFQKPGDTEPIIKIFEIRNFMNLLINGQSDILDLLFNNKVISMHEDKMFRHFRKFLISLIHDKKEDKEYLKEIISSKLTEYIKEVRSLQQKYTGICISQDEKNVYDYYHRS